MHMLKSAVAAGGLLCLAVVAGCSDPLSVGNTNNPDRDRVLAKPSDVEGLVGSLYQQINSATLGNVIRTNLGMMTASFMSGSSLSNDAMGPRSSLPRGQIDNTRGNTHGANNFNDFSLHSQVARSAADAIARGEGSSFTLGSIPQNHRMLAFAYFAHGVALGNLALVYDSAGVPRPGDAPTDEPALENYDAVMAEALRSLDMALDYASRPDVPALPDNWLRGNAMPMTELRKLIRSYKARFRANVARTPAENAAVDWAAVIADATNGITADFTVDMSPAAGWDVAWLQGTLHFRDANWHQMTPYIIGMADTTGAYADWLATDRDAREPFLIRTPDRRFPSGDTRAAQVAVGQDVLPAGVYYRNRDPGGDQASTGWRGSFYEHWRWRAFSKAVRSGPFPLFTRAENDLLAAEGYLRTGNFDAAAALIDRYRVPNGLPSVAGIANLTQPVPGGTACVPQVPVGPAFTTIACGNVLEALKWEKRMETALTSYGVWFFDSRRWGDLPEGTAVHWPVPYQELDARRLPIYTRGGSADATAAAPSTYGFGSGNR